MENIPLSNHPDITTSYHNMALVCEKMGDYLQALLLCEKALIIRKTSVRENHANV